VPSYDRAHLRPRIAHIGVGGFHRAHMALYVHEVAAAGGDWGILGVGLLPGDAAMADALAVQDHLYTLVERGTGQPRPQVIGSIVGYRLVSGDHDSAARLIADPDVAILSLTVTEAGYASPSTTFDAIAGGLERRRDEGGGPLTILSCDNLPSNGDAARRATLAATSTRGDSLVNWVETHCTFPNSMVDRITPVTSAEDREWLLDTHGIDDRWPVISEPFRQWVMEDDFAAGRPRWEDVGVVFSADVHAWELYKLRMLNAAHSCMAYLSALAGLTYVDEAMAVAEVRGYLDELLHREAVPSVVEIPGYPREAYATSVLERFANTGVRDQIARLCIDGTAKYPTFLIPTIAHHLRHDGPIERGALALAGWARYLATVPVDQQSFDASGDAARAHAVRAIDDPARFLDFAEVFPPAVRGHLRFRAAFVAASRHIAEEGPLVAMAG
jgi:mannitol 2-dehydrogenase